MFRQRQYDCTQSLCVNVGLLSEQLSEIKIFQPLREKNE